MGNDSGLTFFQLETGEIISFYNGKQIMLALLVKGNFSDGLDVTTDFEVLEPVVIQSDIFFQLTRNALTGEYYGVFDYEESNDNKVLKKPTKASLNFGKFLFKISDTTGVINYSFFYRNELRKEVTERLKTNYEDLSPIEYAAACDGIIFNKMKDIILNRKQNTRTNKKEDN